MNEKHTVNCVFGVKALQITVVKPMETIIIVCTWLTG